MAEAPTLSFRAPFGILDAAMVLVLAGMALWFLRPMPGSLAAADEERAVHAVIGALANAEEEGAPSRKSAPFLPLDRLLATRPALRSSLEGFTPSKVPGVHGNRSYWIAVLLPGKEGWIAAPGAEDPAEAARGFCVLAWPRKGAEPVLRALAALPRSFPYDWQRADGADESGEPDLPPVPRVQFPPPGQGDRAPSPPPDWAIAKKRKLP